MVFSENLNEACNIVFEKQDKVLKLRMVYYSVSGHGQTQKKESNLKTFLIIRSDTLPLSYRRLVWATGIRPLN